MTITGIGGSETGLRNVEQQTGGGESFAKALTDWINQTNSDQVNAAQQIQDLVVHGKGTIHDAMVAITRAEGSFRLLMEMRNRLVDGVNKLLETRG